MLASFIEGEALGRGRGAQAPQRVSKSRPVAETVRSIYILMSVGGYVCTFITERLFGLVTLIVVQP